MKTTVQSLHFVANALLTAYAEEKVNKLSHLNQEIIAGDVCLKLEKSDHANDKCCELKLSIPGNALFAKSSCKTFEEAINKSVEALQSQLRKQKTKLMNQRQS